MEIDQLPINHVARFISTVARRQRLLNNILVILELLNVQISELHERNPLARDLLENCQRLRHAAFVYREEWRGLIREIGHSPVVDHILVFPAHELFEVQRDVLRVIDQLYEGIDNIQEEYLALRDL